jgi:DNA-directed RNA polymerase specialized sigma24 family protein
MRRLNAGEEHSTFEDTNQDHSEQEFYDRYASILLSYLYQQVSSRQDAEDLLLEVFVAALNNQHLSHLGDEQQLAWLRRVARNKVIQLFYTFCMW